MNDHPTNEEREAMIAGNRGGSLAPEEAADVALLANLLADSSTWAEPRAGLEDDIVGAIERAALPAERVSPRSTAAPRETMTRRRRVLLPAVSVAASVALVVGAVFAAGTDANTDFTARLSATAALPAARASADFTRSSAGFRVVLDARGLPTLPAGEYYQAWLKNSAGTLVPIGTFSSGNGRVTLWSGVSPHEFNVISVTIESTDGNQASSGHKVLVGEVEGA